MKVYQLKLIDLEFYLDPVFKSRESAELFKSNYQGRKLMIKENYLENLTNDFVYRIQTMTSEGSYLEDELYADTSLINLKDNQSIIKECLR